MPRSAHSPHARFDDDAPLKLQGSPQQPAEDARDRFARRRAAGDIADALAHAVGRSPNEAGTARLAVRLASDAGALRNDRR